MKFAVQATSSTSSARAGVLTELGRLADREIHTPACLLYSTSGSAPYLTHSLLAQYMKGAPLVAHLPVGFAAEHQESLEAFGKGMGKYAVMENRLIFSTFHDSAEGFPTGFNDKNGASVWSRGGKIKLDVERFIKLQEAIRPDWYQPLCDSDTDRNSSKKRLQKAVDRTLHFLDSCIEKHSASQVLKSSAIFGVIEGGYDVNERIRSAKQTCLRPVEGFILEGFHRFGPEMEQFQIMDIEAVLKDTTAVLPDHKVRYLPGMWSPGAIIKAVQCGIDLFDSTYPYLLTERGCALVFPFKVSPGLTDENIWNNEASYHIDLNDKRYFDDFTPLLKGCECYTCQNYTKAYLNHLCNTGELLRGVLLMIHNFHHFFSFFETLRKSTEENKLETFRKLVERTEVTKPS
ncbi:queuine tRNA-ribosyltransferase accessory subunit 2-like [Lingula anatina]|uniref:Queuine tRNA-ribosyltransferase accessory subunit 2 n=1 Tax=Lingula anatina TaxID=7574 RepID=A0A1S3KCW3_LINAN|nr:queuine tRNA-ribosyltransferase accessory subunit 2-like [Lingula anatina]|eukprot:XP_013420284.1 queuine tRNA-ribosyltransferase accessory subunit 2-like [Lingula anatina]